MERDIYLTPKACAEMLGGNQPISERTLANWRVSRRGPKYHKIGRLIRYRLSAIQEYLDSREREGETLPPKP